jgi:hypothetical protein
MSRDLTVRIPVKLHEAIDTLTKKRECTAKEIVIRAVEKYLDEEPVAFCMSPDEFRSFAKVDAGGYGTCVYMARKFGTIYVKGVTFRLVHDMWYS